MKQTAGRENLGEIAPKFVELNDETHGGMIVDMESIWNFVKYN